MEYAISQSQRVRAAKSIQAVCQCCDQPMIARCGQWRVAHWAHKASTRCDPWWENETPWHRRWKELFPQTSREVVLKDPVTSERHIADIRTTSGWVIELQHSSIAAEELQSREAFYKKMIWIVDATSFKERFIVLEPLPDPESSICSDKVFYARSLYGGPCWRTLAEDASPRRGLISHPIWEVYRDADKHYRGHHLYSWTRPRRAWLEATKPVLLDVGDQHLLWLMQYGRGNLRCVLKVDKEEFLRELKTDAA